jgi:hypothetical protein
MVVVAADKIPHRTIVVAESRLVPLACRLLAAGVLVIAAFAKLAVHPAPLFLVLIAVELLMALLLLSGRARASVFVGSAVLFMIFGSVSMYKMATGIANCGCFGDLPSTPSLVATMDLSFAIAFASAARLRSGIRWFYLMTSSVAIVAAGIAAVMIAVQWIGIYRSSSASGSITGTVVRLDVEQWVGHAFPISKYLRQPQPQLASGRQLVVIFDPECPRCRELLREYGHCGGIPSFPFPWDRLLFVSVRPTVTEQFPEINRARFAYLDPSREWVGAFPVTLLLDDGLVRHISTEDHVESDWLSNG